MATRDEVYQAILNADKAGDSESVRTLGAYLKTMTQGFQPIIPEPKQSALRQIADVPLGIAKGAAQGVRMLSDVFGAGSGVSTAIKGVETYVSDLMSAQAKQDREEIARIMKDAEDKGILDQVQAGIKAISVAPIDTLTSAFGTAIPAIAAGVGAATLGAPAAAITGAGALIGAGMGAGTIKGSIYEETKTALKELGASEQDAEQKAQLAQSYGGQNLDQILLGTVLGGVAAAGPLEKGTAGILARRILGKAAATETGEAVAKGAIRQRAEAGLLEALPEALQAGQEQVAQNIALQREGMDVPTFRGAVSSATLEGLAGAGLGAAVGRAAPVETLPSVETLPPVVEAPVAPVAEEISPLTFAQKQELERQRARSERPKTAEELLAEVPLQTGKPTTPFDIERIRDEHETAVIEGLLAQDTEMTRANEIAARQRELEQQVAEGASEAETLVGGISDVDRRVREGRIFSRVQDLIDQNLPFASTAISDINQKFGVIDEPPLTETERARVQNIMGLTQVFTDFVKLPKLAPKPVDQFAENRAMEAIIKERADRGQAEPIRTAPVAPSPIIQEAPVSPRVVESEAIRPPSSIQPSVEEDRELVEAPVATPKVGDFVKLTMPGVAGPISRAGKVQSVSPEGNVEVRTQQGDIVTKAPSEIEIVTSVAPVAVQQPVAQKPPLVKAQKPKRVTPPAETIEEPVGERFTRTPPGQGTAVQPTYEYTEGISAAEKAARKVKRVSSSLWGRLRGTLPMAEVNDISPDRALRMLGNSRRGTTLSSLVADGELDDFLPPDMRVSSASFDETDAVEYIKDRLREGTYISFEAQMELQQIANTVADLEDSISALLKEKEVNDLIQEAIDEQAGATEDLEATEPIDQTAGAGAVPSEQKAQAEEPAVTPVLTSYTAEEAAAKQAEKEATLAAEKKTKAVEQERLRKAQVGKEEKARADESVKDFELGRTAEEQMTGMGDMFAEPPTPAPRKPSAIKEAEAFGKAIGAARPYPGMLQGRVNLPAQKAAKEGNFQGVVAALEKSKNAVVAEIARRAKGLETKIVIDEDAAERYIGESPVIRQLSIDGAKMHLQALDKIRGLANQVDSLPAGARLEYDIRDTKINGLDGGKDAGRISLEQLAEMGHSMFAPLSTGSIKLKTKEDFKAFQKAYEDLTTEYSEDSLRLTSTGSAELLGVIAAYDSETDTIHVPEYFAKSEEVLAHEIVHAQVLKSIASPTSSQKPIIARLSKLYEHVKQELSDQTGRRPYALYSIQEFVAEGMGNPAFQFQLKRVKYQNTSAWDAFVQTIANLIGVKRDTAFTELLSVYSDLTQPSPESKSLGKSADKQLQDFQQTLRTLLNKFGLTDVGLKIDAGMKDAGSYAQQLIRIADDNANPVQTLRHEAIHALRELGFFTDAQWKSLSQMAKDKWIDQYLKQRNVNGNPLKAGEESRYDAYMREYKGDMEKITEEAVSDAFADFDATKPPAGLVQAILKRLQNLFQSIQTALTKVESVDKIFGKVEKGELKAGAREADQQTPNFLKWFGNSKVVDEKGKPLVVYHGTGSDFSSFDVKKIATATDGGVFGKGFYFTTNAALADSYAAQSASFGKSGATVLPVYLSIKNPFFAGGGSAQMEAMRKIAGNRPANMTSPEGDAWGKKLREGLIALGYDGVMDTDSRSGAIYANEIVAFYPEQIKSAIGNNGEYSLTDADIRKSLGETKAKQLKTVTWSDKRIDRLISEYGYLDGRSFGMAAFVNPNDFILATTSSKKHADDIKEESGKLDLDKIAKESQTPYLEWDIEKGVILGHEGRHRMAALAAEGVTSAPVLMFIKDRYGYKKPDKYERQDSVTLKGQGFQDGKGKPLTVTNLVPLEPKQENILKREFGGGSDIKFSLRAAPPAKPTMGERLRAAGQEAYQKRKPLDTGAFKGVPEDLVNGLGDVFAPKNETILDRIDGMKDNFWQRVAQGVADQYRTIKEYSEDAYMKARLSKTIDGGLEGLMFHGQVFNDGGALNIRQKTKGLLEVLKPVGKELDRYLIWVALSRDSTMPEGKRSISDDLVSRRNELIQGTIDGQPRLELYQKIQKEMNALNRSVLKVAVDAGLLNTTEGAIKDIQANEKLTDQEKAEKIAELRANPIGYERFINDLNYIPFYKVMEEGDTQNVSTASGLTSQYFSKALKGGEKPFGDLMENTLRNWSHILSASMKNQAAEATIDAAVKHNAATPNLKIGLEMRGNKVYSTQSGEMVGDGSLRPEFTKNDKGAVKVMMDGQPTYYMVTDPFLLDAISAIGYMGPQSKFLDVAKDFKNLLQFGVTISPTFKVNNLIRDSVSAMGVSELKKNPIANVLQGISLADKNSETYVAGLAGGAIFNFGSAYEGDQSRLIKRLLKQGVARDSILDTKQRIAKGLRDSFDKYQEWGNKSESANRLALYKQLRDAGMSHLEASFKARDLLDFSMQGSWPAFRILTQVIPFLNARIQGLYKLGRDGITPTYRFLYNSATGKEIVESDKQKAQSFMIVTAAVGLASAALYLAFKDDEDYKKRDDWDRDNFWWMKLPGMDAALRIPKPFEIGAFGTLVERTLEQIYDSGSEGKQFTDSLSRTLSSTFAMNPIPQVIKPLYDIYANKDSFTGAPIESAGLEKLSKQERQIDTTSPLAIALGGVTSILPEAMELSPVQVDYMIKGYFGWLGGTAASISMGAVAPFKDGEYPDTRWMDKASLGLVKQLPSPQSKYVTAFYESNKEISQAFADMRHYQTIGDTEKAMEILEDKGDLIALSKMYDRVAKDMGSIRTQIRIVTNDPEMSGEAKQEAIERMKMMLGLMAQQAEELRKSRTP